MHNFHLKPPFIKDIPFTHQPFRSTISPYGFLHSILNESGMVSVGDCE
jgi:hypothetical protein